MFYISEKAIEAEQYFSCFLDAPEKLSSDFVDHMWFQNWSTGFGVLCVSRIPKWHSKLCWLAFSQFCFISYQ